MRAPLLSPGPGDVECLERGQLWDAWPLVSLQKNLSRRCPRDHKAQWKVLSNHSRVQFAVCTLCGSGGSVAGVVLKICGDQFHSGPEFRALLLSVAPGQSSEASLHGRE